MGLRPVVYEAEEEIGGRMRSTAFPGHPRSVAELGAMRFPPSSTTLFGYLDEMGLQTVPFPNPLAAATPDTVIDLKGTTVHGRTLDDLPDVFARVAQAWQATLDDGADLTALQTAIRSRDTGGIATMWHRLVRRYDDTSFYRFLTDSPHLKSFTDRELFGQVGFGTGGWDTDFSNSILEVLRVVATAADDDHRGVVGGCRRLPLALWSHPLTHSVDPLATSVAALHKDRRPRPAVIALDRSPSGRIAVTDAAGETVEYPTVVNTAPVWLLLSTIRCDESLFDASHWSAIERTHYMGSSKVFVLVDRPFWRDRDPSTGRYRMSMTLTDRMPRAVYLMDGHLAGSGSGSGSGSDDGDAAVICLSYTWTDDSLRLLPLAAEERMELMLSSLARIYPDLDLRRHIIAPPLTVSWEMERNFMGAFRANLPGHYRYQERLFTHFMQDDFAPSHRGLFLAGDDISWTAGWAEGAVQTALNAVWGVMHHLGGACSPENPGPGDRFAELRPIRLPD